MLPCRFVDRRLANTLPVLAGLVLVLPVRAAELTPTAQLRRVQSDTVDATTGYTCLQGGPGPPLPGCPVDLGTSTPSDVESAPGFDPFSATASTPGGSASQTSSIGSSLVTAEGSSSASASSQSLVDPNYLLVLRTVDPSTSDVFELAFDLDEASPFTFGASGEIRYPDPAFPLSWGVALHVSLSGPGGEIASLAALPDYGCVSNPEFFCVVAPTPVSLAGTLEPGSYTLSVELTTSAAGGYIPSVGPVAGAADGSYAVSLGLPPAEPMPALREPGALLLAGVLALLGLRVASRPGRPSY
jgi:hypothetical protein